LTFRRPLGSGSSKSANIALEQEARQRERLRKKSKKERRRYPIITVAYYGPDDQRASKVVVGVAKGEGVEAELHKWYSEFGDVRTDPAIQEEMRDLISASAPKQVVAVDRIWGCPHEEGIDYPEGEKCPLCPFWRNRDRDTGQVIQ
jgi:hypothetical protein